MEIRTVLKNFDMFGKPIQFNFNKNGSTFNTQPGGCFSLLINFTLLIFCILRVKEMVLYGGDLIKNDHEPTNFDEIGEISFQEANFMPYITIKDPNSIVPRNLKIDLEELSRYLHVDFLQID